MSGCAHKDTLSYTHARLHMHAVKMSLLYFALSFASLLFFRAWSRTHLGGNMLHMSEYGTQFFLHRKLTKEHIGKSRINYLVWYCVYVDKNYAWKLKFLANRLKKIKAPIEQKV